MLRCRFCKFKLKFKFLDMGDLPIANTLYKNKRNQIKKNKDKISIYLCEKCLLVQASHKVKPKKLFTKNYPYLTSTSQSLVAEYQKLTRKIIKNYKLSSNSFVLEIASNDGYFLSNFVKKKIQCLGVEPSLSAAKISRKKNIPTLQKFYSHKLSKKIQKADLIIANNVIAHIPNILDFFKGIKNNLKSKGIFIVEFAHLQEMINKVQFDKFYHEHFSYYSLFTLKKILKKFSLKIIDLEKIPYQGGSLRLYISHDAFIKKETFKVSKIINNERKYGITKKYIYRKFETKIIANKKIIEDFFKKNNDKVVCGYGAGARTVVLTNFFNLDVNLLNAVFDKSPLKINRYLPSTSIKILSPRAIKKIKPDIIVIFPYELSDEIIRQVRKLNIKKKIKFVTLFPKFKTLN